MDLNHGVFSNAIISQNATITDTNSSLTNNNNNNNNINTLHIQDPSAINQLTITKKHHKHFFANPFHSHHQPEQYPLNQLNNASSNNLVEYSSEALLQYVRDNNFQFVKEILSISAANSANKDEIVDSEISALKRTKIDLEILDEVKQTPLLIATRNNFTEIALLLLEHGADVKASDADGWTPLLNASREGNLELVEKLVSKEALIEARDCGGFTPLMWACYKNRLDVVRTLLKKGANVNAQCKNSISCLSWAAGRGSYQVVCELLDVSYVKVNSQDRNSSTPLLWAARKGSLAVCEALINKGANPELIGMNNMTPLIISCKFGHLDVALYLTRITEANINHLDKDGHSALSLAAKNGYTEIVLKLLEKGAYVNIPNKKGDSVLITAVKNGHKAIMDALLSKHVEIDAIGSQGKTALYHAIEKGNVDLVRALLAYKPDLEIVAQDGDTLLLLAVKKKAAMIVNELLNHGSKVSPTDKNGDNALHISLRNKSREITELILANPKNSKYLYKPNKKGETPYKIDASNPKSILTQIFGARQLNMTEDSILGYDLYSSAIAEILSEPSLHTPITVGLYAKWGSGKSFLLSQLKNEMKSFARQTCVFNVNVNKFLVVVILFLNLVLLSPFFFWKWLYGLVLFVVMNVIVLSSIYTIKYFAERREKEWAERIIQKISVHLSRFKMLLKVLFLNPDSAYTTKRDETFEHKSLKFIFAEYGKISTIGGENSLALMVASLYSKIEQEVGAPVARLCRAFYNKNHSHGKFKRFCCIPTFVLVVLFLCLVVAIVIFVRVRGFNLNAFNEAEHGFLITIGFVVLISVIGSSYTWCRILWNLIRSPKSQILSIAHANGSYDSKVESFIFKLKREVDLIAHMVHTLDAFSHSRTRLCIVIDGLDSCEQSRVVQILEIVHVLFTREGDPFINILAVDPHVLIRGIEGNLTAVFRNGSVNGHDYLRTIIHLPVFLQVDLSRLEKFKTKTIGQLYQKRMSNATIMGSSQDGIAKFESDFKKKLNKKKLKSHSSVKDNKAMSAYDLTDQLIKSDYFLDVNPRNLRRLINIIALTGRLLRAYHIDFNWRMLASWIYLNEQWPYRCSWIVMHYEEHQNEFTEETTLDEIYDKIKHQIPNTNEPLLELDRNARKFELFLSTSKPTLTVVVLKKILPCTCNLDPYLIKLIKDSIDNAITQDKLNLLSNSNTSGVNLFNAISNNNSYQNLQSSTLNTTTSQIASSNFQPPTLNNSLLIAKVPDDSTSSQLVKRHDYPYQSLDHNDSESYFKIDMFSMLSKPLSEMNVSDLCDAIDQNAIESLSDEYKQIYKTSIRENNINGKVLSMCCLDELKLELKMTFGDWQLFKNWILMKRKEQIEMRSNSQLLNAQKYNKKLDASAGSSNMTPVTVKTEETKSDIVITPSLNLTKPISPSFSVTPAQQPATSHRKVEFHVTPVIEITDESTPTTNLTLLSPSSNKTEPKPALVIKQNKDSNKENIFDSLLSADTLASRERNLSESKSINSNASTVSLASEHDSTKPSSNNEQKQKNNSVTKLGKKIVQSLENLFTKNSISLNSLNSSHTATTNKKERRKKNNNVESENEKKEYDDYDDDEEEDEEDEDSGDQDEDDDYDKKSTNKKDTLKESETNTTIISLNVDESENETLLQKSNETLESKPKTSKSETKHTYTRLNSLKNRLLKRQNSKDSSHQPDSETVPLNKLPPESKIQKGDLDKNSLLICEEDDEVY